MAQRVTFYIDGFNFYYGLRRTKRNEPQWADYYWIDMVKLCHGKEQSYSQTSKYDHKRMISRTDPVIPNYMDQLDSKKSRCSRIRTFSVLVL